jgi:catechol-2,3-dioxygenase
VVTPSPTFGCYFRDPEANQVEVYWQTGKAWPQPYAERIDLSRSEEELMALLDLMPPQPTPEVTAR